MTVGEKETKAAEKQGRRAESLRENLHRRKAQTRIRDKPPLEPETSGKGEEKDSQA
ncbi:MAG: hypothetical protein HOO00_04115 [Rhodospirillaceae bacterium]|jgi:hypothetical protein|nr:hypothetical protein [Rhodospirillaceae bacterium]MBT5373783.1 hypothetical protein [Rhodospirillaceae bacterium]MBT5659702.1 hypothetical protein [Rhodospirillaceae bacterium]MBT5752652.1 hypothetical protein [Rhodospirillaceae bacterium]